MAPGTLDGRTGRSTDQPHTGSSSRDRDITELLTDGWIGSEHIRGHKDLSETAALTAMHRQHRRRSKGGEGITQKEITPPDGPTVLFARVTRLLTQPLHHTIQLAPGLTTNRRLESQTELQFPR